MQWLLDPAEKWSVTLRLRLMVMLSILEDVALSMGNARTAVGLEFRYC